MTSNIAESMNNKDNEAKDMPVTPLMEWLRLVVQSWFFKRRQQAECIFTDLVPKVDEEMQDKIIESSTLTANASNSDLFEVSNVYNKSRIVNMKEKTCRCFEFNHDQLSCIHVPAASKNLHMGVYEYCSYYHTTKALKETYTATVYPLGNSSTWELPDELKGIHVDSPSPKISAGRPRTKRLPSGGESIIKRKCPRCGRYDNSRQTCKFNFKDS